MKKFTQNTNFVTANGINFYYQDQGTGSVLFLLHGGLTDHRAWDKLFDSLSENYRVIALDTRGHGKSGDKEEPMTYRHFAEDIVEIMNALKIEKAYFAGHSDGGNTCIELALCAPDRIKKMILIGVPYHLDCYPDGTIESFQNFLFEDYIKAPGINAFYSSLREWIPEQEWENRFNKLIHNLWIHEPQLELSQLSSLCKIPCLILHGENETYFSFESSKKLAEAIDAEVKILLGCSHNSLQERPALLIKEFETFFC